MLPAKKAAMLAALKEGYGGEAIFRASAASRWLGTPTEPGCPGSVQLVARIPKEVRNRSTKAAREGSGAHALAEIVLKSRSGAERIPPRAYLGQYMRINGAKPEDFDTRPDDFILVDEEMVVKIGELEDLVDS